MPSPKNQKPVYIQFQDIKTPYVTEEILHDRQWLFFVAACALVLAYPVWKYSLVNREVIQNVLIGCLAVSVPLSLAYIQDQVLKGVARRLYLRRIEFLASLQIVLPLIGLAWIILDRVPCVKDVCYPHPSTVWIALSAIGITILATYIILADVFRADKKQESVRDQLVARVVNTENRYLEYKRSLSEELENISNGVVDFSSSIWFGRHKKEDKNIIIVASKKTGIVVDIVPERLAYLATLINAEVAPVTTDPTEDPSFRDGRARNIKHRVTLTKNISDEVEAEDILGVIELRISYIDPAIREKLSRVMNSAFLVGPSTDLANKSKDYELTQDYIAELGSDLLVQGFSKQDSSAFENDAKRLLKVAEISLKEIQNIPEESNLDGKYPYIPATLEGIVEVVDDLTERLSLLEKNIPRGIVGRITYLPYGLANAAVHYKKLAVAKIFWGLATRSLVVLISSSAPESIKKSARTHLFEHIGLVSYLARDTEETEGGMNEELMQRASILMYSAGKAAVDNQDISLLKIANQSAKDLMGDLGWNYRIGDDSVLTPVRQKVIFEVLAFLAYGLHKHSSSNSPEFGTSTLEIFEGLRAELENRFEEDAIAVLSSLLDEAGSLRMSDTKESDYMEWDGLSRSSSYSGSKFGIAILHLTKCILIVTARAGSVWNLEIQGEYSKRNAEAMVNEIDNWVPAILTSLNIETDGESRNTIIASIRTMLNAAIEDYERGKQDRVITSPIDDDRLREFKEDLNKTAVKESQFRKILHKVGYHPASSEFITGDQVFFVNRREPREMFIAEQVTSYSGFAESMGFSLANKEDQVIALEIIGANSPVVDSDLSDLSQKVIQAIAKLNSEGSKQNWILIPHNHEVVQELWKNLKLHRIPELQESLGGYQGSLLQDDNTHILVIATPGVDMTNRVQVIDIGGLELENVMLDAPTYGSLLENELGSYMHFLLEEYTEERARELVQLHGDRFEGENEEEKILNLRQTVRVQGSESIRVTFNPLKGINIQLSTETTDHENR